MFEGVLGVCGEWPHRVPLWPPLPQGEGWSEGTIHPKTQPPQTSPSIRLEPIPAIAQMQPHRRPRCIAVLASDRLIDRFMLQTRQLP